ncbi:hypothetical protein QO002_003673 [Pararhizobium capsulatum DSM 1112]|uniref:Uncharacterized protein n=1 Tax=Pararhizobium capsulatum DSM 1112 TaxID=1121113 RepID=A0ABU0BTE4_9HYPH|nr:hypothetical protein [Pararhizobium capsulatum DSM 1112]
MDFEVSGLIARSLAVSRPNASRNHPTSRQRWPAAGPHGRSLSPVIPSAGMPGLGYPDTESPASIAARRTQMTLLILPRVCQGKVGTSSP